MADFKPFADAVHARFEQMKAERMVVLTTDLHGDKIWDAYLAAFPEGSNPIFRERTEHDCSCCRNFIKNLGGLVCRDPRKACAVQRPGPRNCCAPARPHPWRRQMSKVVIPEEIQALAKNCKTRPNVIVVKLISDAISREYDDRVRNLLGERRNLLKDIYQELSQNPMTRGLADSGALFSVETGMLNGSFNASFSRHGGLLTLFKSVDVGAPRSGRAGLLRMQFFNVIKKGPAWGLLAELLIEGTSTSQPDNLVYKWLNEDSSGMDYLELRAGRGATQLKHRPNPDQKGSYFSSGTLVRLETLNKNLYDRLHLLSKVENLMIMEMYKDIYLILRGADKVKNVEALIRKVPVLLEHPELKAMLGYDINPQADRIATLSKILSGQSLLG